MAVYRIYVKKKDAYAVEAAELLSDLKTQLNLDNLDALEVVNRYDVEGISEEVLKAGINTILSEPMVDEVYYEEGNNVVEQITKEKRTQAEDEPVAVKKLKEESLEEHPKAVQEMEDKKKIEEIQRNNKELEEKISNLENKILEDKKENEETKEDKVTQNTINFRHQKALDEFYKNAEEIEETVKVEKKSRSKGKHSM